MHVSVTVLFLGPTTRRRGTAHVSELFPDSKRATPASKQVYTARAYLHQLWSSSVFRAKAASNIEMSTLNSSKWDK